MEAVGPVLEVLKCIWGPVSRRVGYAKDLKKNFEKLKSKILNLQAGIEDVNRKINNVGGTPTRKCAVWLEGAQGIQEKWKEIVEEYQKDKRCLGGWCPNVSARFNLGKRVVELIEEAADLTEKSNLKEEEIMTGEPPKVLEVPTTEIEANTAAERTLQDLLGKIKEVSIKSIGIWGMGGIGKTTIMKKLNNHPEVAQIFEIVIWATVSKEGAYRNVQSELAERLSVKRQDGESNDSLKSKIFQTLKTKKFLLLLDDVWDRIDLEVVGVPPLDDFNGCKMVLSTRDYKVCNKMKTDEEIKIEALSEEESWSLFRREIGEFVDFAKIESFALDVAKECHGLPLAIVVVGRALRKEDDVYVWSRALNELRSPINRDEIVLDDMEEVVFGPLKFSYDRLKHEKTKECFLYCALYPEDRIIAKDELIEHWTSEGIVDGRINLKKARDEGFSILKILIDSSLLERSEYCDYVRMHDVLRDLALRIMSAKDEGCKSLVKAGVKLSKAPRVEDWELAKRISLVWNDLKTLPQMPNCRTLTTLLLQGNSELKEIPPYFFEHMPVLQVLNLSSTGIFSLPPSVGSLANLRGLFLNHCENLKVVPSEIGGLAKLELFQMKGRNQVCCLPPQMGDLESLKDLEVQCCPPEQNDELQAMEMFPTGSLSKMSGLERLGIIHGDVGADEWWVKYSEGVSQEVAMLSKLTHLVLSFSRTEHLEHFVRESPSWRQRRLTSFCFCVGQKYGNQYGFGIGDDSQLRYWRSLYDNNIIWGEGRLAFNRGNNIISDETREILTRVDALGLGRNVFIKKLSDLGVGKMNLLKICLIVGCQAIESIIDGDDAKQSDLLPNLFRLVLCDLPNLRSIWEGPLPPAHERRCFPRLTVLNLRECHKLKAIFSRVLIQHLSYLEELWVVDCSELGEIISMENEGEEMDNVELLPRLKTLVLDDLRKLTCICSKELSSAAWPSLEKILIYGCKNLKSLPCGFAKAPNLERIVCDGAWWKALEWEEDAIKRQLDSKLFK